MGDARFPRTGDDRASAGAARVCRDGTALAAVPVNVEGTAVAPDADSTPDVVRFTLDCRAGGLPRRAGRARRGRCMTVVAATGDWRPSRVRLIDFLAEYGFVVFFAIWVIFLSIATDTFLTETNLLLLLRQASIYGIPAIGATFVILLGELDISFGVRHRRGGRGRGAGPHPRRRLDRGDRGGDRRRVDRRPHQRLPGDRRAHPVRRGDAGHAQHRPGHRHRLHGRQRVLRSCARADRLAGHAATSARSRSR